MWELDRWKRDSPRRSRYRVLVLFGLSPRTRYGLLVVLCRRFFRRYPGSQERAKQREDFQERVKARSRSFCLCHRSWPTGALALRRRSRLVDSNPTNGQLISPGFWDDWRELLLAPDSGALRENTGLETQLS